MTQEHFDEWYEKWKREQAEREAARSKRFYKYPVPERNPETGKRRCRVCLKDLSGRRISFCSDECSHKHWFAVSSAAQRQAVYERDKGVCSYCGKDTDTLAPADYGRDHLWEAHHVVAVAEMTEARPITLDDLKTACWECHPRLTGELRRRLNKRT